MQKYSCFDDTRKMFVLGALCIKAITRELDKEVLGSIDPLPLEVVSKMPTKEILKRYSEEENFLEVKKIMKNPYSEEFIYEEYEGLAEEEEKFLQAYLPRVLGMFLLNAMSLKKNESNVESLLNPFSKGKTDFFEVKSDIFFNEEKDIFSLVEDIKKEVDRIDDEYEKMISDIRKKIGILDPFFYKLMLYRILSEEEKERVTNLLARKVVEDYTSNRDLIYKKFAEILLNNEEEPFGKVISIVRLTLYSYVFRLYDKILSRAVEKISSSGIVIIGTPSNEDQKDEKSFGEVKDAEKRILKKDKKIEDYYIDPLRLHSLN